MQLSKHRLTLCHLYPTSQAAAAVSNVCRSFTISNYGFHLHLLNHWCIQTSDTTGRILLCRHRSTKICTRGSHSLKHDADGEYDVGCKQRASVRWECRRHRRYNKNQSNSLNLLLPPPKLASLSHKEIPALLLIRVETRFMKRETPSGINFLLEDLWINELGGKILECIF